MQCEPVGSESIAIEDVIITNENISSPTRSSPTAMIRIKNNLVSSLAPNSKLEFTKKDSEEVQECEEEILNDRRSKADYESTEIDVLHQLSNEHEDDTQIEITNPSEVYADGSADSVNDENGCYNPSFTKSETAITVDIDNKDDNVENLNMNHVVSASRQNSLTNTKSGKTEKDPNVKNVL